MKKLKRVEIKGLWREYDLTWDLNPKVNILTGSNGAGKSTILDLIASVLTTGKFMSYLLTKIKQMNLVFEDETTLVSISFDDTLLQLKKEAARNEIYQDIWDEVSQRINASNQRVSRLNRMGISASVSYFVRNRKLMPLNDEVKQLNVNIISTFDTSLPPNLDEKKLESLKEEGVRSPLDMELHDLQEKYAYYLSGLANRLEKYVTTGHQVSQEYVSNLYAQKNLFIQIVNEMFSETGKRINIDNSKLEFIVHNANSVKRISMYELSSGEKQLLCILMTVLMQEQKDVIMFMDEPEISLHVDWQEILVEKILLLNPNCQLIIATHAPSLLLRGWQEFVTNVDDLKQN